MEVTQNYMDGTFYYIKDSSIKEGSNEWKTY